MSDGEKILIRVNGAALPVTRGVSVAAALLGAGVRTTRRSVSGEARGAVCGMGICFECRATIDGIAHRRTCLATVAEGMSVEIDGAPA